MTETVEEVKEFEEERLSDLDIEEYLEILQSHTEAQADLASLSLSKVQLEQQLEQLKAQVYVVANQMAHVNQELEKFTKRAMKIYPKLNNGYMIGPQGKFVKRDAV